MANKSGIDILSWCMYLGYVQTGTGMDDILLVSWLGSGDWIRGVAVPSDTLTSEISTLILDKSFLFLACN